jgi:hypothetical protein
MGYRFIKKAKPPTAEQLTQLGLAQGELAPDEDQLYIRGVDAGVVRAATLEVLGSAGASLVPNPEDDGARIPAAARDAMVVELRDKGKLLLELADFMDGAKGLRWEH